MRLVDQQGNAEADTAADLGRRHRLRFLLMLGVVCFRLVVTGILFMTDLHRFMIAVAWVSVNHDGKGGTAPGSSPGFLNSSWIQVATGRITGADIAAWPYSVGILVRISSFLNTLHWPSGSADLGHFGVSFLELLILFEHWAGHRLFSEKVTRPHVRAGRPILFPSVPVSEGIEIQHGCQFISSLVRALAKLPGGLGRFMPCHLGSDMSRLRHLGWNQCSHGLNSRPLESCHH